ncbi:MAG: hypothetical protein LBQ15_11050 [Clostridium sp.]|jgi:hypothetical protein|nr:hypothetical protein [Clostridium sp.]
MKPNTDTVTKTTESGTPLFETEAPALLYRRGAPPKCVNIETTATLQFYAYPNGESQIGIWAEGVHVRVPLADLSALVAQGADTLRGFTETETDNADR